MRSQLLIKRNILAVNMDFFTHLVFGMITALLTLREFDEEFVLLGIIMAVLPDADLLLFPLHRITKNYYLSHRGGSHSYIIGALASAIVALIFNISYRGLFYQYWLVGFLFYSLHVTLDFLTTSRIPLFYPISKKELRFAVDRAVNLFLMISSFSIFILSFFFTYAGYSFTFRNTFRLAITYIYYLYLGYRIILKICVQLRLSDNIIYIPGVLPMVYYLHLSHVNKDFKNYQLIKKVQLIPLKLILYESKISNPEEVLFLNKTLSISKEFRFFSKWSGIMPIIQVNQYTVKVIIFLAESYSHGFAYFIRVIYDKPSGEVIEKKDGFYFINQL